VIIVAMPALYHAGSNVLLLYHAVFVVYWCYGSQLSVNAAAAADFWGTKNAGTNYGLLFTSFGVSGILGPRIGGVLYDRYHNYQAAFYIASALAVIALLCEFGAKRPVHRTNAVQLEEGGSEPSPSRGLSRGGGGL
jgi:MFS transporter, OFA family, oxalate/formate antiporter